MRTTKLLALYAAAGLALAGVSSTITAQEVPNAGRAPTNAPPPHATKPGPYAVTLESDPSFPTHAIYRPTDMSKFGPNNKLPIIGWGNGGCLKGGKLHETFLRQIASNGYFVVAVGPATAGLAEVTQRVIDGKAPPPLDPNRRSPASMVLDGVNWAIAQNAKGQFAGKLDTAAIGVMGQSCGGGQAITISSDPRVKTTVVWNSGAADVPPAPNAPAPAAGTPPPVSRQAELKGFHAPVAYFIGGPTDLAYTRSEKDFTLIEGVPLFNANINTGHGGTFNHPNAGWFGEVGVAWLNWQLKGDKEAAKMFTGAKCGLCTEKDWTVKRKNIQ